MHKITLICSAHQESGICNAAELLKHLLAIEPEVVFEEVRNPSEAALFRSRGFVEACAIDKYREHKLFRHIPVDRYFDTNASLRQKEEFYRLFALVNEMSEEYRRLVDDERDSVRKLGFRYLNSAEFARNDARMVAIENSVTHNSNNPLLIGSIEKWRHLNQEREREMVVGIYEYCKGNAFDTGVFLVGAAHKSGIVREIARQRGTAGDPVIWNLDFRA